MPEQSAPDMVASLAAAGPAWPECFTEEDKRLMAAVDFVAAGLSQEFAIICMKHRQQVFSALLNTRSGLN